MSQILEQWGKRKFPKKKVLVYDNDWNDFQLRTRCIYILTSHKTCEASREPILPKKAHVPIPTKAN